MSDNEDRINIAAKLWPSGLVLIILAMMHYGYSCNDCGECNGGKRFEKEQELERYRINKEAND